MQAQGWIGGVFFFFVGVISIFQAPRHRESMEAKVWWGPFSTGASGTPGQHPYDTAYSSMQTARPVLTKDVSKKMAKKSLK